MRYLARVLEADGALGERAVDAVDTAAARRQLTADGVQVLSLRPKLFSRGARFPLVIFCDQLLTLLRAGIPLREALATLAENEDRPADRQVVGEVARGLGDGHSLSAAMEQCGGVFPELLLALVRASERTGTLDDALDRYAGFHRKADDLRAQIVAAAAYPALLVGIGGLVIVFLLFHVVPRFAQVYADLRGPLPLAARGLLLWGNWVHDHGWLTLGVLAAVLAGLAGLLAHPATVRCLRRQTLRLPRLGETLERMAQARLYRSLSLLLRAGIPVPAALGLADGLVGPERRPAVTAARAMVIAGGRLSQALADQGLVTPVALRLLRAGEMSGQLPAMLERAADFLDREATRRTELLSRLLGPLLMLALGTIIGLIVVMLYLPIFQLAEGLG